MDLKTKRPFTKKPTHSFSERSEQTISDCREPTKINGSARLNPCLSRQFATVGMSESIPRCEPHRRSLQRSAAANGGGGKCRVRRRTLAEPCRYLARGTSASVGSGPCRTGHQCRTCRLMPGSGRTQSRGHPSTNRKPFGVVAGMRESSRCAWRSVKDRHSGEPWNEFTNGMASLRMRTAVAIPSTMSGS